MRGAESVAADLRAQILGGDLAVGAPLAPERDLAEQLRISRTTLRAALTILEGEGLVVRRVGRGGGTFVAEPGADEVTAALQRAVRMSGFPATDLAEARLEIEPRCAGLAARRVTDEQLAALRALQSTMARSHTRAEFFAANARFHGLIAEASGNAVLAAVIGGLTAPIRTLTDDPVRIREAEMAQTVRVHEVIIAALTARDPVAAESAMRSHLRAHVGVVRQSPDH